MTAIVPLKPANPYDIQGPLDTRDLEERFQKTELGVKFPLEAQELEQIFKQYQEILACHETFKNFHLTELQQEVIEKPPSREAVIAIGMHTLYKRFKIKAYDTQIFTLLGILACPTKARGRLSQVKTGEGKSTIVTLLAFVLAAEGNAVDIISSSHYLAIRDQQKYAPFFKSFGMTTAHICDPDVDQSAFEAKILYGMVTDFEFALMRETIKTKKLFSEQRENFTFVIVDEVDNLLIDTSMNSARLAEPASNSNCWVFRPLFDFVQTHPTGSLAELRLFLAEQGYGQDISDKQLEKYRHSALRALTQKQNIDYVLIEDPKEQNKMIIQIIDKENTGRLCEGLRWGDGLHEFLELKHHLSPEKETMTPLSMSHAVFYEKYRDKIFGLSGTLGSSTERKELQAIYQLDHFDSPVHHSFKRIDYSPEIFWSIEEYQKALITKVQRKREQNRPVLILCSSIQESEQLYSLCEHQKIPCQLFNEMQSALPETIIGNAGFPGQVTITTNNAGRGTDIKLYQESLQAGGLHVILTFYPYSQRVEEQALGRAGRQGNKGSSEIVLLGEKLQEQCFSIKPLLKKEPKDTFLDYLTAEEIAKTALVNRAWKDRAYNHPLYILRSHREKMIAHQFDLHVYRSQSERLVAEFVAHFWKSLKTWKQTVTSPEFFKRITQVPQEAQPKWDGIRKIVHLEKEAVETWVERFYGPVEKLILHGEDVEEIPKLFELEKAHWEALFEESQFV